MEATVIDFTWERIKRNGEMKLEEKEFTFISTKPADIVAFVPHSVFDYIDYSFLTWLQGNHNMDIFSDLMKHWDVLGKHVCYQQSVGDNISKQIIYFLLRQKKSRHEDEDVYMAAKSDSDGKFSYSHPCGSLESIKDIYYSYIKDYQIREFDNVWNEAV